MKAIGKIIVAIVAALLVLSVANFCRADTLTDSSGGTLTYDDWKKIGPLWVLEMIYTDTDGNGTTGIDIPVIEKSNGSNIWQTFASAYVELCETDPSAVTAPDDDYDITIRKKTGGLDMFQGGLLDRSTSATQSATPLMSYEHPDDTLQLIVENQTTSGAIVAIKLQIAP